MTKLVIQPKRLITVKRPSDAWPIITENNISIILNNPLNAVRLQTTQEDLFDDAGQNVGVI